MIDLDDLPRGFRVLSCTVAATSGFRCIGAALDELAKWRRDESGVNVDREVIASIRAMTVTHDAARLFGFSSPLVREGWHHEQVHRGTTCEVFVSRGATWQANPAVSREATMKLEPDRRVWAREYLAEPADAVTSPFEQGIDHLVARGLRRRPPVRGLKYGLRFDVGLRGDRTGILVYHSELRSRDDAPPVRVLVIDHAELLKPSLLHRVSLDDVEKRIVAVARDYFVTEVGSDLSYADALAPRLRSRGLRHVEATMGTAAQEKRSAALMSMVATGSIDLLDDRDLLAELRAVELRLSGGRWLITAPDRRGAHDDLVDCLLLAVEHAAKLPASGGDTEIEYGPVLFRPQTDRVLSGGEARYFRRLANGVRIPVDPPEGTREAEQARATRLAAGMFTAADVAALGEEEVARRINVGVE